MSLLHDFGLTRAELRALLEVPEATLSRWLAGRAEPPAHVVAFLRVVARGELAALDPAWEGWRLEAGALVSPWGARLSPAEAGLVPQLWGALLAQDHPQGELFPRRDNGALVRAAQACGSSKRRRP